MNNLSQIVKQAQAAIDNQFVFVHVKTPDLQTLLNGLEESKKRVEELEALIIKAKEDIHAGAAGFAAVDITRYFHQKGKGHEAS